MEQQDGRELLAVVRHLVVAQVALGQLEVVRNHEPDLDRVGAGRREQADPTRHRRRLAGLRGLGQLRSGSRPVAVGARSATLSGSAAGAAARRAEPRRRRRPLVHLARTAGRRGGAGSGALGARVGRPNSTSSAMHARLTATASNAIALPGLAPGAIVTPSFAALEDDPPFAPAPIDPRPSMTPRGPSVSALPRGGAARGRRAAHDFTRKLSRSCWWRCCVPAIPRSLRPCSRAALFALALLPELCARLVLRAFSATYRLEAGVLHIGGALRRLEVPCSALERVRAAAPPAAERGALARAAQRGAARRRARLSGSGAAARRPRERRCRDAAGARRGAAPSQPRARPARGAGGTAPS